MSTARIALYQRLPEIYRIRDFEQTPPGQLAAYVGALDEVFAAIRDDVEALYHDLFIETCADWAIPYIGDLLGTSHLSGDAWTLRADIARTIHHRRRKGTLGAIESLTFDLTGWAVHAVELRERLCWNQHLSHQRPDAGGAPPLSIVQSISAQVRGGTVNLRDPAALTLLGGPFDPCAHVVDVKPRGLNAALGDDGGYNLPNLAIFLWRLEAYTAPVSQPVFRAITDLTPADAGEASFAVRFDAHPMGEPMVLFNTHRFSADDDPPSLAHPDAVPGPMPAARVTRHDATDLTEYVQVRSYTPPTRPPEADDIGLTLYVPPPLGTSWRYRGANLCAWEAGLEPPLGEHEIAIDPARGRIVFGVAGADETVEAEPLRDHLLIAATYGFAGPTGAHPVARPARPDTWAGAQPLVTFVDFHADAHGLQHALDNLKNLTQPLIVEIQDSMTHDLDIDLVLGTTNAKGDATCLQLGRSLWIRAASGERPVIRLARPLRFRPNDPAADLDVRLEGLYLTRDADFDANTALIERAALNQLFIDGCTLDPGGALVLDGTLNGTRAASRAAMKLDNHYGFADAAEETVFDQTPLVVVSRSICGPLLLDDGYTLSIADSIVDAGSGVEAIAPALAIGSATNPGTAWGAALNIAGATIFGRTRVVSAGGRGGIFLHALEAHDDQSGCIKLSYFAAAGNRLPPHHACVFGDGAQLAFTSEVFGAPGYAQLHGRSDARLLEQGPGFDAMGAFGYLQNAHKWKNISIRYREFMPVGVRPVVMLVT